MSLATNNQRAEIRDVSICLYASVYRTVYFSLSI
jgi:hypothetical protein